MSKNSTRTEKFKLWMKEYWWTILSPLGFIVSLSLAVASGDTKTVMTILIIMGVTMFTILVFTFGFWLGQMNMALSRLERQMREVRRDIG